ncbi:hypothetical protein [Devosia sp. 919]|uniref:hypothetical protein n=1 Tax=Devosia sp. 919 TaxID=2726065 RepID=UPI0015566435|nr:hypothetical protein [Devosia sp. 919]
MSSIDIVVDASVSGTGGAILVIQAGLKDIGADVGRDTDIVTKQLFANLSVFGDEFYVVYETCGQRAKAWLV